MATVTYTEGGGGGGRAPRMRKRHRPQRPTERVTVQGPVSKPQPDGMSHGGGGSKGQNERLCT